MTAIMDYPEAWEYTAQFPHTAPPHDQKCSSVPQDDEPLAGPGLLCDCHVLWDEYARRREAHPHAHTEQGGGL